MTKRTTSRPLLSKDRLEAIIDGIYAVAMTLLVLELKIPEGHLASTSEFQQQLASLIPKLIAWLISFFILCIFWMSTHRVFRLVERVDTRLAWLHLWSLLFVSLLPFSSDLVGEHGRHFEAEAIYAINMAVLGLIALLQLVYIERHPELRDEPIPVSVSKGARFRCWSIMGVAALALVIAFVRPTLATLAFVLMAPLGRIGRRMEARDAESEDPESEAN